MPRSRINKRELQDRLRSEGRWADFVAYRERIRGTVPDNEIWEAAAEAFPPVAIAMEIGLPVVGISGEVIESAAQIKLDKKEAAAEQSIEPGPRPAESLPEPSPVEPVANAPRRGRGRPPKNPPAAGSAPASTATQSAPKVDPRAPGGQASLERVQAMQKWSQEWLELFNSVPAERKSTEYQTVKWLYENSLTSVGEINPDEVPCRGAVRHLKLLQSSDSDYVEFIKTVWVKMLPTRNQLDFETGKLDNGEKQLVLLVRFDSEFASDEGHGKEPISVRLAASAEGSAG